MLIVIINLSFVVDPDALPELLLIGLMPPIMSSRPITLTMLQFPGLKNTRLTKNINFSKVRPRKYVYICNVNVTLESKSKHIFSGSFFNCIKVSVPPILSQLNHQKTKLTGAEFPEARQK